MKANRSVIAASLLILLGVIIGLIVSSNFNLFSQGYTEEAIPKESIDLLLKINKATEDVVNATKPAVVNITSTKVVHLRGLQSPFLEDPFFREFFGNRSRSFEMPKDFRQSGIGSGVIVDRDGYILTNNHVIDEAEEINVKVSDKNVYRGKVVGKDPKTDLAVVKISATGLPMIRLGNSDELKVGDRVIAIGNPMGLNQTVTSGIISATGRANVGIADYEDFIQTDAPINPGNSGGALVNAKGELIGINTAIASSSGGYQGIGFAIPSNMAKVVMEKLIRNGKVIRGWLGVSIQPVTPELARQLGVKGEKGALVADVVEGSPADKAGMHAGDVITEFDGRPVEDVRGLRNMVADVPPGKDVGIRFFRDGHVKTAQVTIKDLPAQAPQASGRVEKPLRGLTVQNLTPEIRSSLNIPSRVNGVVITGVDPASLAGEVLLQGDVIMEVNRMKVRNVSEYQAAIARLKPGQTMLLLIYRNGSSLFVTLKNVNE
jgi:serine protease Do